MTSEQLIWTVPGYVAGIFDDISIVLQLFGAYGSTERNDRLLVDVSRQRLSHVERVFFADVIFQHPPVHTVAELTPRVYINHAHTLLISAWETITTTTIAAQTIMPARRRRHRTFSYIDIATAFETRTKRSTKKPLWLRTPLRTPLSSLVRCQPFRQQSRGGVCGVSERWRGEERRAVRGHDRE